MLKRRNRHPCLPLGVKSVVFVLGDPAGGGRVGFAWLSLVALSSRLLYRGSKPVFHPALRLVSDGLSSSKRNQSSEEAFQVWGWGEI